MDFLFSLLLLFLFEWICVYLVRVTGIKLVASLNRDTLYGEGNRAR